MQVNQQYQQDRVGGMPDATCAGFHYPAPFAVPEAQPEGRYRLQARLFDDGYSVDIKHPERSWVVIGVIQERDGWLEFTPVLRGPIAAMRCPASYGVWVFAERLAGEAFNVLHPDDGQESLF